MSDIKDYIGTFLYGLDGINRNVKSALYGVETLADRGDGGAFISKFALEELKNTLRTISEVLPQLKGLLGDAYKYSQEKSSNQSNVPEHQAINPTPGGTSIGMPSAELAITDVEDLLKKNPIVRVSSNATTVEQYYRNQGIDSQLIQDTRKGKYSLSNILNRDGLLDQYITDQKLPGIFMVGDRAHTTFIRSDDSKFEFFVESILKVHTDHLAQYPEGYYNFNFTNNKPLELYLKDNNLVGSEYLMTIGRSGFDRIHSLYYRESQSVMTQWKMIQQFTTSYVEKIWKGLESRLDELNR